MSLELLLLILCASVIGACIGTVSGLIPGIHVNTLATILIVSYPAINSFLSPFLHSLSADILIAVCIVSASVVHSTLDFVPSVFLGAPDADEVTSMLPGHKLLNEGRGMVAVRSAAIGSVVGAMCCIIIAIPLQYILISGAGTYLDSISVAVIFIASAILIIHEKNNSCRLWALIIFVLAGILGVFCMNGPVPSIVLFGDGNMMLPLLSGLFGMPAMLTSLKNGKIIPQTDDETMPVSYKPGIKGVITGCIAGWFPGITATTGAIIASEMTSERKPENFISLVASIGSASTVFALVTLSVSGSGRSGTMLAIRDVLNGDLGGFCGENFMILLLGISIAVFLGYFITIESGKIMCKVSGKINMKKVNTIVIGIIILLTLVFTGPYGLLILGICTMVGFLPIYSNVGRASLTGCLLIPALLSGLGITEMVILAL